MRETGGKDIRAAIVEEAARLGLVEEIVQNVSGRGVLSGSLRDLVQDVYCILLTYDVKKIQTLYLSGELQYFITRVVLNQYRSATSPYYAKYKRFLSRCVPVEDHAETYACNPCCW